MPKFKNIKKSPREESKKKVVKYTKKIVAPKKDVKKKVSPKIPRPITENGFQLTSILKKKIWIIWGLVSLILCVEAGGLYYQIQQVKEVQQQRVVLQSKLTKWEKILSTHPGYRDGYMKLAMLDYQLGDKIDANKNIENALTIDPNYIPALKLKGILLTSK